MSKKLRQVNKQLQDYYKISTIEEHLLAGGFGSFLLELGLNCQPLYLDSTVCGEVGGQKYLKEIFGLNRHSLITQISSR